MMYNRRDRYQVTVERQDGTVEMIQCNSRCVDAVKRAKFVAKDRTGWPSVVRCFVVDTRLMGVIRQADFLRVCA